MTTDILNSVAAGYTAGVCGVVVGHPMDSAKVWLQTAVSESRPTSKPVSASVSNLASSSTSTSTSTPSTLPLSPRPLGPMSSVIARSYATIAARAAASDTSATASKRGMSTIASRYSALAAMSSSGTVAARIPPHSTRRMTLRALYAGVSGPLVTVGWVQSLNFCIYDTLRRTLHQQDNQNNQNNDQYSLRTIVISSGTSGAVISFVTNPLLVLKTKQQLMTWGFRRALQDTLRSGNSARLSLSGFYTGFSCHFLYESVGRGLYVGSYECFKQWMSNYNNNKTTNVDQGHVSLTIPQRMMSAGAAGTVSCAVMFPFDALRSRLIASSLSSSSPTMAAREGVAASAQGAIAMGRQMLQEGGTRSFYRGFGVTIIRSGPVAAAVLPIYDVTLEWLNQQP